LTWPFQTSSLVDLAGHEKIFSIDGRDAVLRTHSRGTLNQSHHFVIEALDFASEDEAVAFAKRIKDAMLLSSIAADFGVYFDNCRYLEVKYIPPATLPMLEAYGEGVVPRNPAPFFAAFEKAVSNGAVFPDTLEAATEIYSASTVDPSPIASLILAMSCIEALVKAEALRPRPVQEKKLLKDAIAFIRKTPPPDPNDAEGAAAFETAKQQAINSITGMVKEKSIRRSGKEIFAISAIPSFFLVTFQWVSRSLTIRL
jgi:hypothetical protein